VQGRQALLPLAFESIFQHHAQRRRAVEWTGAHRLRRIIIADFAKNIFATWQAAIASGVQIVGVFDPHPAFFGLKYRGTPIWPVIPAGVDGVIIANVNPAQIDARIELVREQFSGPILRMWHPVQCPVPSTWFGDQRNSAARRDGDPIILIPPRANTAHEVVRWRRA
jgi:hypothetical protein